MNRKLLVTGLGLLLTGCLLFSCKEEGDTINLTSTSDDLTGLQIDLPTGYPLVPGLEIPLRCYAIYRNSALQDWTARVQWSVVDPRWATITPGGTLRILRAGSGEVTATSAEGWTTTQSFYAHLLDELSISLESSLVLTGETTPVTVRARLDDGSNMTVSSLAPIAWTVTNPTVAHMTSGAYLQGDSEGLTAVIGRMAGTTSLPFVLTVDRVVSLSCLEVTVGPYLPLDTIQYVALGQGVVSGLMEVTDRVDWWTSDALGLMHLGGGVFVATEPGTFECRASLGALSSPAMSAEVWNLTGLSITPATVLDTLDRNDTLRFSAFATIEGHGVQAWTNRATWVMSAPEVGEFAAPGVFVAKRTGRTDVFALSGLTMSNRTAVTVDAQALLSDGFENYPLGTFTSNAIWEVYTGSGYTRVAIGSVAASGSKGCSFIDSASGYTAGINNWEGYFGQISQGSVQVDIRPGPGFWLWVGGPYSSEVVAIVEFYSGYLRLNGSSYIQTYDEDTWYNIRVDFDCSQDEFDLYVDGVLAESGVYSYSGVSYIDNIGLYTSPADYYGVAYADNAWVTGDVYVAANAPAPGPVQRVPAFDWWTHRRVGAF